MISSRPLLSAILALALLSGAASARAASFAGYGFRTGVASTALLGDQTDLIRGGSKAGFAGTLFTRFSLGRLFSIQPELGWTSKGDEGDLSFGMGPDVFSAHVTTSIDYLEIPVLLRLHVPTGSSFEPYFLAGPGVAFRVGSSQAITDLAYTTSYAPARIQRALIFEEVGTFDDPQFRDVDWNVIAGGGLAFGRAPLRIVLDSRYALGLTAVYPSGEWSWAHNGAWITTLGIELR